MVVPADISWTRGGGHDTVPPISIPPFLAFSPHCSYVCYIVIAKLIHASRDVMVVCRQRCVHCLADVVVCAAGQCHAGVTVQQVSVILV